MGGGSRFRANPALREVVVYRTTLIRVVVKLEADGAFPLPRREAREVFLGAGAPLHAVVGVVGVVVPGF